MIAPVNLEQAISVLGGDDPAEREPPSVPQRGEDGLALIAPDRRRGPASLHDYRAAGGYEALRRAIELGPAGVIRELKDSGLMGRGGAAFPTGVKWEAVAQQAVRPHYLICNADESEPGHVQGPRGPGGRSVLADRVDDDRRLRDRLRARLHLSARRVPAARVALQTAIATARHHGYLGPDVLDHGFKFELEIRNGAGAYICGEETAIFNSIEGFRGEPRAKPPFPTVKGLFGKPTVVNNVETLVNVLAVLADGGPAYARIGTEKSTGRSCSACPVTSPSPASTRSRSARRSADCWRGRAASPARARSRRSCSAAPRACSSDPIELDMPLTFEGVREAQRDARLGSRGRVRRHCR